MIYLIYSRWLTLRSTTLSISCFVKVHDTFNIIEKIVPFNIIFATRLLILFHIRLFSKNGAFIGKETIN